MKQGKFANFYIQNAIDIFVQELEYKIKHSDKYIKEAVKDAKHDLEVFRKLGITKEK